MKLRVYRAASLALLSGAVLVLGCKPPPSKGKFNNGIAEANLKLGQKALVYRKVLFPQQGANAFDPDNVDSSALTSALGEMDRALREVKEKYDDPDFTLPNRSPASAALKSAYDDYLAAQSKILDMAKGINDALADPKLGKADKKRKVEDLLDEIRTAENAAYKKVEEAQKSVSDAHHFKLVTKLE